MKRALPPPVKAESERWNWLNALGCIVCRRRWRETRPFYPAEIHHINEGGRNISHWHTLPFCVWHHRGICNFQVSEREMTRVYGPSLIHGSKVFAKAHGRKRPWIGDEAVWPCDERRFWELVQRFFRLERPWPVSKIVPRRFVA